MIACRMEFVCNGDAILEAEKIAGVALRWAITLNCAILFEIENVDFEASPGDSLSALAETIRRILEKFRNDRAMAALHKRLTADSTAVE